MKKQNTSSLLKTFQMGKITLPCNVFYSPLAGCSDHPFRMMASKYKPGLQYCEMVKMDGLVRSSQQTYHYLDFDKSMHPIGGQLVGGKPEIAGQAARILEDLGFDVIDLNCGCPVDKVAKDGSGSGMLKDTARIGDTIANMVASVSVPVTVKIRTGWDENNIVAKEVTQIAEAAGAVAIAIHGRTRAQAYKGKANWDHIRDCVDVAKTIKVIGNGDVFSAEDAERMFKHTGCDAVLVSRGTLGQPWIAEDIQRHLSGLPPIERSCDLQYDLLLEHFDHMLRYHPEKKALIDLRRVACWYLKRNPSTKDFRKQISKIDKLEDAFKLINDEREREKQL